MRWVWSQGLRFARWLYSSDSASYFGFYWSSFIASHALFLAAIFGQQLFMGKMINCNDALIFRKDECIGNMSWSGVPRRWMVLDHNFGISLLMIYRLFFSDLFCHRLDRSVIVLSVSSGDFRFLVQVHGARKWCDRSDAYLFASWYGTGPHIHIRLYISNDSPSI